MTMENRIKKGIKCKDCQKPTDKFWWIVEGNQNFKLCRSCSDKRDRKIWAESLKEYHKNNPQEKKVVEIDWWKLFFFLSTITLLIILIVVLNNK
ncbi:MAG: hypothetical protein MRERV_3c108 [Mycoplasmataceae bacterium RV_VA103A]|nr:MAG: hypothetical protein MRERV_3c108 [Mycoplasmataceae bacterium RV_VA103A]